jgi:hypothetical protein
LFFHIHASAFGLDKGVSFSGYNRNWRIRWNAETYLTHKPKVGARFITLTVVRFTIPLGWKEFIAEGWWWKTILWSASAYYLNDFEKVPP